MKYIFYDPHPGGIMGAIAPLPFTVKEEIDRWDGKTASIEDVLESIQRIAQGMNVFLSESKDMVIGSVISTGGIQHMWRLLRCKPA